mmetsp:Transcript_45700/g.84821  ORF Transcript_45700/g.84821 Transcript_45700/m.84821 type:complete len:274 (-) Transcript_45700:2003-2824(-)
MMMRLHRRHLLHVRRGRRGGVLPRVVRLVGVGPVPGVLDHLEGFLALGDAALALALLGVLLVGGQSLQGRSVERPVQLLLLLDDRRDEAGDRGGGPAERRGGDHDVLAFAAVVPLLLGAAVLGDVPQQVPDGRGRGGVPGARPSSSAADAGVPCHGCAGRGRGTLLGGPLLALGATSLHHPPLRQEGGGGLAVVGPGRSLRLRRLRLRLRLLLSRRLLVRRLPPVLRPLLLLRPLEGVGIGEERRLVVRRRRHRVAAEVRVHLPPALRARRRS